MKKLSARCLVSDMDLMMVKVQQLEKEVKNRLVRDLAEKLIHEVIFTEQRDHRTLSKEITAEIYLTDKDTVTEYNRIKEALKTIKELG